MSYEILTPSERQEIDRSIAAIAVTLMFARLVVLNLPEFLRVRLNAEYADLTQSTPSV